MKRGTMEVIQVNSQEEIPSNFTGLAEFPSKGSKYHFKDGKLHRDDGPAAISRNGIEIWFQNGEWHRADGPAVVFHGKLFWYLNGVKFLSENDWLEALTPEQKENYLNQKDS